MNRSLARLIIGFFICFNTGATIYGQEAEIDSLRHLLTSSPTDTITLKVLNELSERISDENIWPVYNKKLSELAIKLTENDNPVIKRTAKKYYAASLNNKGYLAEQQGHIKDALKYWNEGLRILKEIGDKEGMSNSLLSMGYVFSSQGNISEALDYCHQALKIKEELNDKEGVATALHNIGGIYLNQSDTARALDYFQKGLVIKKEVNDKNGIAYSLLSIGYIYMMKGSYEKARRNFEEALRLQHETKDNQGIAYSLQNIATLYEHQNENEKALNYYRQSLEIRESIDNKQGVASALKNIGTIYLKQNDIVNAESYGARSLSLSKKIGYPENIRDAARLLKDVYTKKKDFEKAINMYDLYVFMRDSINNSETQKNALKKQFQYQYEKKEVINKALNEKKDLAFAAKSKQQNIILFGVVLVLVLLTVFFIFLYRRYVIINNQKSIIEIQKHQVEQQKILVETKNKEITDSITYAQHLQQAILPPLSLMNKYFPESFVLYKPKDIVAGDFYWMHVENDLIFIAAADSTGHGVPGAIVSVVCSGALNRAVNEFHLTDTGKILDKARELVLETFEKSGSEVKDGMDISLCSINLKTNEISWSGANNPLWYFQNEKLNEIKAHKESIGKTDSPTPFPVHHLKMQKNDTIYLITDGYADQFGGPKGKKYKNKKLQELLMNIQNLNMRDQKVALDRSFKDWKGYVAQVDDVTIIGIRI